MAESRFFEPLQSISPPVRYISYEDRHLVLREKFALVLNLSHRQESQELAGSQDTEELVGGYLRRGALRVAGAWQEYRASLVHNNRHNRFHWADMNALDVIDPSIMAETHWSAPRFMPSDVRRIGLFLGASAVEKRPSALFWSKLVRALEKRNWLPVLLGGPAEKDLCRQVQDLCGRPVADACGTLGLDQLAFFGQTLAALITPDTGPMHLAAWTGLRVLNLSMGPVHAWETGPYQPGHVVLRSTRSCVGCWECRFDAPRCHASFEPGRIVRILEDMLDDLPPHCPAAAKVEVLESGRRHGLYHLEPCAEHTRVSRLVGAYWQAFWMHALGVPGPDRTAAAAALRETAPALVDSLRRTALLFFRSLSGSYAPRTIKNWDAWPLGLRPLTGYVSVHLANHDFSPAACRRARALAEKHLLLFSQN
jgi:hypothetical protein